ncbi:hypothetical protein YSA_09076 [Pseudomonas putida ND6]|uniref:Uncharacterized protein n=1 Tax=Pseudomonas putida ND6 TaxID=231023 RepID=I3V1Q5_PSEPU|nr:hypothetical protein YSA_09076 [Pseudomonas putida ND6]
MLSGAALRKALFKNWIPRMRTVQIAISVKGRFFMLFPSTC